MPASSKYAFVLTLDGSDAVSKARTLRTQLQKELATIKVAATPSTNGGKGGNILGVSETDAQREERINKILQDTAARRAAILTKAASDRQSMVAREQSMTEQQIVAHVQAVQSQTQREIDAYNRAATQKRSAVQMWARAGYTQADVANMGNMEQWGAALQAGYYQTAGLRRAGMSIQQAGRGMMMAGGAAIGASVLTGKQYLDYSEQAQRAAANVRMSLDSLDSVLLSSTNDATKFFKVAEQSDALYQWSAATGLVVNSEQELQAALRDQVFPVEQLAAMSGGTLNLGTAINMTSQILSQYNMKVDETSRVTTDLNAVSAYSQATVSDLGQAYSYVGEVADQLGISFEDTGSALQILSDSGQKGSRAGRGLAMALSDIIKPSQQAADALDRLFGGNYQRELFPQGQFVGLDQFITRLATATEKMSDAGRQKALATIFDQNALRAILPLIDQQIAGNERNIDVIRAMTKARSGQRDSEVQALEQMLSAQKGFTVELESSVGIMNQMWSDFENSDVARARGFENRWNAALVSVGKSVVETSLPTLEQLADALERVAQTATDNPDLVGLALKGAATVVGIGGLVTLLGKGITLYADAKMIGAAVTMKTAAQQMMDAAVLMQTGGIGGAGGAGAGAAGVGAARIAGSVAGTTALILSLDSAGAKVAEEGQKFNQLLDSMNLTMQQQEALFGKYKPGTYEQLTPGPFQRGRMGQVYNAQTGELATEEEIKKVLADAGLLEGAITDINRGLDASSARWQALGDAARAAGLETTIEDANGAIDVHIDKLNTAHAAYMMYSEETRQWLQERTEADIAGRDPYETVQGRIDAEKAIDQQRDDNAKKEEQRAKDYERQWRSAYNDQKRAYEQAQSAFRSSVAGILQPTSVTAEDMTATQAGQYGNRWDEYARRLRAAAQGSAEWKHLLPADLEMGGDQAAIQQWVNSQIDSFYAGGLPGQVDWDAFSRDFQAQINQTLGRENLIDRAIKELETRGITAGRADVQRALGIESPLQQMFFGGQTPEEAGASLQAGVTTAISQVNLQPADLAAPGTTIAGALSGSVNTGFAEVGWTAMLVTSWTTDLRDNYSQLETVGHRVGSHLWNGIESELAGSGLVATIVAIVLESLANEE